MRRLWLVAVMIVAGSAWAVPQYHAHASLPHQAGRTGRGDRERTNSHGCGVERWAVKTGTDPDARLLNLHAVPPTTIHHLTSLPPPHTLPARHRGRPVETTVSSLTATVIRYRLEPDSDYHLVLRDGTGPTMIAELPAPRCVGSRSEHTSVPA